MGNKDKKTRGRMMCRFYFSLILGFGFVFLFSGCHFFNKTRNVSSTHEMQDFEQDNDSLAEDWERSVIPEYAITQKGEKRAGTTRGVFNPLKKSSLTLNTRKEKESRRPQELFSAQDSELSARTSVLQTAGITSADHRIVSASALERVTSDVPDTISGPGDNGNNAVPDQELENLILHMERLTGDTSVDGFANDVSGRSAVGSLIQENPESTASFAVSADFCSPEERKTIPGGMESPEQQELLAVDNARNIQSAKNEVQERRQLSADTENSVDNTDNPTRNSIPGVLLPETDQRGSLSSTGPVSGTESGMLSGNAVNTFSVSGSYPAGSGDLAGTLETTGTDEVRAADSSRLTKTEFAANNDGSTLRPVPFPSLSSLPIASLTANPPVSVQDMTSINDIQAVSPEAAGEFPASDRTAIDSASDTETESPLWKQQIKQAILSLQKICEEKRNKGETCFSEETRLRLLCLSIGHKTDALVVGNCDETPAQNFWVQECKGLDHLLNAQDSLDSDEIAEQSALILQSGLDVLNEQSPLRIPKALFVHTPACFGLYKERLARYHAGDTVFAYAELNPVVCRKTETGYEIYLQCDWELQDSEGRTILSCKNQPCTNTSASRLRDIVLNISVVLPASIPAGEYRLNLSVTDYNRQELIPAVTELPLEVVE